MIYYIIFLLSTVAIDQFSKLYMIDLFKNQLSIPFIKGVLNLTFAKNTGAAFSIFRNNQMFLIVLSAALIVAMMFLFFKGYKEGKPPILLCSLLLVSGGAIGNLIDRIRLGYVVDFFETAFINFPIFNVGDIFICVGMGIILVLVVFFNVDWP